MADNIERDATSGGKIVRTLEDSDNIQWAVGVTGYATSVGTPDVLSIVTPTNGLPVQPQTGSTWSVTQSGTWTITISGSVTVDTELPAAAALADNTANPSTTSVGTFGHWFDGTTWDRARGDSTDGLLVNLGLNNDVTVTGSVTANAGTNLNTSLLALESGGNLAAAALHMQTLAGAVDSGFVKISGGGIPVQIQAPITDDTTTHTPGSSQVFAIGAFVDETATDNVTENRIGALRMTADRKLLVRIVGSNDSSGRWDIDNGSGPVHLSQAIPAGDNNIGNVDIVTVPADPFGANADAAATAGSTGSMQAKFRLMTSQLDSVKTAVELIDNTVSGSELQVDVVGSLPAGTNAIGKLSANSGVDIGDVDVTSVVPGTGATNLGKAIDTATGGTDTGVLVLATRDDALSALTPIEGDNVQLRVDVNGALWVSISGSVTVAQATAANLNCTEASAAAIKAAVEIMDDWDETNRCAVNPISGQVGVQGGAGAATALTQRVAIATDANTVSLASGTSTNEVVGDVAEDVALSGNPVRLGVRASRAIPSSMSADGDVVTPWADREGRQVVKQQSGTGTTSSVADSATSVTVLAANTQRLGATVQNDSDQILYLKLGATATTTDYTVKMGAGSYYEVPYGYTGIIDGIWASNSTGSARVTEIT